MGGYEFEFADPTEPDTLEGEEWRDTIGDAQVSSLGRFRSTMGVVSTPAPPDRGLAPLFRAGRTKNI